MPSALPEALPGCLRGRSRVESGARGFVLRFLSGGSPLSAGQTLLGRRSVLVFMPWKPFFPASFPSVAAALHQSPLPAPQPAGLRGIGLSAAEGCGLLSGAAIVYATLDLY